MNDGRKYCSTFHADSSETVAYNNPLFPVYAAYGFLSSYPDYSAISHWHRDLEFILVKKGAMTYNVNGELIELSKGTGIMVNSRQLHYGFSAEHKECEFICLILSPDLLQGNEWFFQTCIEPITESPACPYLPLDRCGWKASVWDRLETLYTSFHATPVKAVSCFEAMEHFSFILKELYENLDMEHPVQTPESSELTALRNMMTYIEEHYTERITLADIALSGACCKSRCSLLFKKYLQDTPITYTAKLRLKKSLAALLDSDQTITAIAYEYGFGGASYYCEIFKKYYGISPFAYKKNRQFSRPTAPL